MFTNFVSDNEGSLASEGSEFIKYGGPFREKASAGDELDDDFGGQEGGTYGDVEIYGDNLPEGEKEKNSTEAEELAYG
jgi:hypothetical protein